jgi:hypothetical protein
VESSLLGAAEAGQFIAELPAQVGNDRDEVAIRGRLADRGPEQSTRVGAPEYRSVAGHRGDRGLSEPTRSGQSDRGARVRNKPLDQSV